MADECLWRLAEYAGLLVEWTNYRGESCTVDADVLRAVLAAMRLPADSEGQCREALEALQAEQRSHMPALMVARSGEWVELPPVMVADSGPATAWLHGDSGEPRRLPLERAVGACRLRAPAVTPGYYTLEVGRQRLRLAIAPARCLSVAELVGHPRAWGLAAQLYSLPRRNGGRGDGGIGDFTALAELAQRVGELGADALAISPVHALFSADVHHVSPYSPSSRLFLNVLHIDAMRIAQESGLAAEMADPALLQKLSRQEEAALIDWPAAAALRLQILRAVWDRTGSQLQSGEGETSRQFLAFRRAKGAALEQHCLFEALHAHHFRQDPTRWHWRTWPAEHRDAGSPAALRFAKEHKGELAFHAWLQWLADSGLASAQQAAEQAGMGIGLVADLAVGTDTGGSHAWGYQEEMLIGLSVGAPPDLLNRQGQNWGLTTFSPRALVQHGYTPFIDMLRACLGHARGLRIDHVLGLRRLWVIPEGGSGGAYLRYPLDDLLKLVALESWRHRAVICGEDLGTVPEGLRESLADEGVLGMRVLWFERDHGLFVAPDRWSDQAMAVTTTHDLPTVAGWWCERDIDWRVRTGHLPPEVTEAQERAERAGERRVLWAAFEHAGLVQGQSPGPDDTDPAVEAALAFVGATPAPLVMAPLEDALGLEDQPNLPGTTDEHPNWRRRLAAPAPTLLDTPAARARLAALRRGREQDGAAAGPRTGQGKERS